MASIQKRTRNGKTTYRVQYRDPSLGFSRAWLGRPPMVA